MWAWTFFPFSRSVRLAQVARTLTNIYWSGITALDYISLKKKRVSLPNPTLPHPIIILFHEIQSSSSILSKASNASSMLSHLTCMSIRALPNTYCTVGTNYGMKFISNLAIEHKDRSRARKTIYTRTDRSYYRIVYLIVTLLYTQQNRTCI